jgi:four helix bundle protein
MYPEKENLIVRKTYDFSLAIIAYTEILENRKQYNMANQLFRSGTAIGANVREAQGAETKADFRHKIKIIAYKEAEETNYWLELCRDASNYPAPGLLIEEIGSLKRILGKIISSSQG